MALSYEVGVRPTSRVNRTLQWEYPGAVYRPETRRFKNSGSINMIGATGNYDLAPAAGEKLLVNRVSLIVVDGGTSWDDGEFGEIAALATGFTFTLRKSGSQVHDFTADYKITTNQTLFAATAPDYSVLTLDTGNRMCVATWDLVGSHAPVLLDGTDDILRINVGDALTGLVRCEARADCFLIVGDE